MAKAASPRWSPSGQFAGTSICTVGVSPGFARDRTIWAGSPGAGLFASTDSGMTWRALPIPHPKVGTCGIAFSPDFSEDHLAIAVSDQAYVTRDLGASWEPLGVPLAPSVIAFSPAFNTDGVALAVANEGPIYRTSDAGSSWTQVADWQKGLPAEGHFIATSLVVRRDGSVLLGTGNGVYRSPDLGGTWSWANSGLPVVQQRDATTGKSFTRVPQVAGLTSGRVTIYAALRNANDGALYRSTDGGASWSPSGSRIPTVPDDLASVSVGQEDVLLVATNSRGVLRSSNGGLTWSGYSKGLSDQDIVSLVVAPDGNTIVAGAGFDGVFTRSLSAARWSARFSGMPQTDPTDALIAPRQGLDSDAYAGTLSGVFRSANGGFTWTADDQGLPGERSVLALASLPDAKTGYTLLAGTSNGLFRSAAGRGRWRQIGARSMRGLAVSAVAVSPPSTGSVVAAGSENGLFESFDSGVTWHMVVRGAMNIQALRFARVGADIGLYALCAGRLVLYRGKHETVISGGLNRQPILAFTVVSALGIVFAATANALFRLDARRPHRLLSLTAPVLPVLQVIGGRTLLLGAGARVYIGTFGVDHLANATVPGGKSVLAIAAAGRRKALVSLAGGGVWHFHA